MITGYILFLMVLVVDFFLYAWITAYFDGTLDRIHHKGYLKNEKDTTQSATKQKPSS